MFYHENINGLASNDQGTENNMVPMQQVAVAMNNLEDALRKYQLQVSPPHQLVAQEQILEKALRLRPDKFQGICDSWKAEQWWKDKSGRASCRERVCQYV